MQVPGFAKSAAWFEEVRIQRLDAESNQSPLVDSEIERLKPENEKPW